VDGLSQVYFADYKEGADTYRLFVLREPSAARAAARYAKVLAYFNKEKAKSEERSYGG